MAAKDGVVDLRVVFWNTWLLAPRVWPGGPRIPGGEHLSLAPDVPARAVEVGKALAGRFDVAALSEVFEPSELGSVAAGWPEAEVVPGPGRRFPRVAGSGLATLVDPAAAEVKRVRRHAFRSGGDLRDSDTYATKGALLVELELQEGFRVDVVSTHLFAGGDLLPIPGSNDRARHHRARMAQVDELLAFVALEHRPDHVLVVVGDFNVPANDADPALAFPTDRYDELRNRMEAAGLFDVWAPHGIGLGHTCTFATADDIPADPAEADAVLDRTQRWSPETVGERIDYLWLKRPEWSHIVVERPRRWAFPGRGVRGGPAGSLSDHLALSVTLRIEERKS